MEPLKDEQHLDKTLDNLHNLKQKTKLIEATKEVNYLQHEAHIQKIKNMHNNTMGYIDSLGIQIWKSYSSTMVYYSVNPFGKKEKINTNDDFHVLLKTNINVYDSIDKVQLYDDTLLLVKSLLPIYKDDILYPWSSEKSIKIGNYVYRNIFQYSHFLCKRILVNQRVALQEEINQVSLPTQYVPLISPEEQIYNIEQQLFREQSSYILEFLKLMTQNGNEAFYIFSWLAYFFQTMNKTNIALVLIGDTNVTNILIEQIIKPIFAYKKEYFINISDDTLKKTNETIIKDKIFYHIGELSEENSKKATTSKLVREILMPHKYAPAYYIENNETYVWGQLIVTAEKETPFSFLKESYSNCCVFKIKHIDTILKKLKIDRITLDSEIQNDLDNFSNYLAQEDLNSINLINITNTPEKNALPSMRNGILMTPKLSTEIEYFIKNIEEKNINYFQNIQKEDSEMYEELVCNFNENMIAQPLLSQYFNLIYDDIIFTKNNDLLDILKEMSTMFKQKLYDNSKYNGKKRYTITS